MDYIQINPDNVAPSAPRPRIRKAAAYLLYRQLISGGGGIVTDDLVLRSNFNDMANLSLTFPSNGSAEFNGTSDYIQTNEEFAFVNSAYSVSFWAYLNGSNTGLYPTPFQNGAYNQGGIQPFYLEGSDYIRMAHNIDGGNAVYGGTIGMAHDEWFYITFTFDGTSIKSYKDGSLVFVNTIAAPSTNLFDAKIGGGVADTYWNGNLANVAIWNRVLSSDEINSVMWKQYEEISTSERNGLQAWYALDSVDTFADWYTYAQNQGAVIEGRTCVDNALNALAQL